MKVVPNWVILVITVLVFTIAFGGTFFLGSQRGAQKVELRVSKERVVALEDAALRERKLRVTLEQERARLRDVSGKLQAALQGKDIVYEEVTTTIFKEVEKPVYLESVLPASGVQVLSDGAAKLNSTRSAKN